MASLIYDSLLDDISKGNVNLNSDTFFCMLLTSSYAADKKNHKKRSDLTNEVAASGGYVAGGFSTAFTVAADTANDRENTTMAGFTVNSATITARYAAYYKHRGGAASADELVALIDLGADITSTNGAWALTSSVLRLQN